MKKLASFVCPFCGHDLGGLPINPKEEGTLKCGKCGKSFGVIGAETILSDKLSDITTDGKVKIFNLTLPGDEISNGCFVCGGPECLRTGFSFGVKNRPEGEKVISMFDGKGVRFGYRNVNPKFTLMVVGGCVLHYVNLSGLNGLLLRDEFISAEHIKEAKSIAVPDAFMEGAIAP